MQIFAPFIFGVLSNIYISFENNFSHIFFYYYLALFSALALSLAFNARRISRYFEKVNSEYYRLLLIAVLAFVLLEVTFVQNYHLIYNDEYIYMSMAKSILVDHIWGICSFSTATNCVPGTIGFFHQPGGWSFLLALAFGAFGIHLSVAYALTFLLGVASIVLIFFVSYLIFRDERPALMASVALASMPLFMSYSRTSIPDISVLAFILLSVLLSLIYLKKRDIWIGVSALLAIAYLMTIKVDSVVIMPVVLIFAAAYWSESRQGNSRAKKIEFAALLLIFAAAIAPQVVFLYHSSLDTFGAAIYSNQSKISIQNFEGNVAQNAEFWFGAFDAVRNRGIGYNNFVYNIAFPVTTTIFAIVGVAGLIAKRRFRELAALLLMFAVIFVFYTSFYAGGVTYGLGVDTRYFLGDFAVIAMLSGFGFVYLYEITKGAIRSRARQIPGGIGFYIMSVLLVLFLLLPAFQFMTITSHSPSTIATYAGERADESFILSNLNKIPLNCTVMTFQPPLWYVNGRADIYATWANIPQYARTLSNMSKCMYFDYDLTCYVGSANGTGYQNTHTECSSMLRNYTVEDVASQNYTGYSWNVTFHIYKILGRNTTR